MIRAPLVAFLALLSTCGRAAGGKPATPTPVPTVSVPEGYHTIGWGTPHARVLAAYPDLHPSKNNPRILIHEITANHLPATEAFFFDLKDEMEEVEVRFSPKRSPLEAADLARGMDEQMGPHDVPLADDNAYQFAWTGTGTEVRLTYDLRDEVAFGPVIAWAPVGSAPVASHVVPATAAATTPAGGTSAGSCFATAVKSAREGGMHLTGVEGGHGKLTLVFESAGSAKEINLTADHNQKLIACGSLARASGTGAVQFRAEGCLDRLLGKGPPTGLKFGGPGGFADLVTLSFKDGGYVSLKPGAADALMGCSANSPK